MHYANFIQTLKLHANKPLVFVFEQGAIQPNYHITEVLKQQIHAIDCGGALDQWNETLIQLLEPRVNEAVDFMPAHKALDILFKSDQQLKLVGDSEVVLEFRAKNLQAAQRFFIADIQATEHKLLVTTQGARTQCKAAARQKDSAAACCGPSTQPSGLQAGKASRCCA